MKKYQIVSHSEGSLTVNQDELIVLKSLGKVHYWHVSGLYYLTDGTTMDEVCSVIGDYSKERLVLPQHNAEDNDKLSQAIEFAYPLLDETEDPIKYALLLQFATNINYKEKLFSDMAKMCLSGQEVEELEAYDYAMLVVAKEMKESVDRWYSIIKPHVDAA